MNYIVQDFSPVALIKAIEANSIDSFKSWAEWSNMELHQDSDITWTSADIPFFLYNVVLELFPQSGDAAEHLGQIITGVMSRARSRQAPMGWWVGPNAEVPNLGFRLEEQGWFHAATLTGMAMDLFTLEEPASLARGLTISPVRSAETLETWCQIMTSVSEFPDFAAAAWSEMYRDIGMIDHPQWRLYLGSVNGVPVSTSALFLAAGVAGIHGVTTLPEHRGRGIGTAMTYSPLLDARNQGYRVGALFSSDMAVGVYGKIGFQKYCQGDIYMWMPEGDSP